MTDLIESQTLPTTEIWEQAKSEHVLAANGTKHTLGGLIGSDGDKVVLIFIRHFWCGICQHYVTHLSTTYPTSVAPAPPRIIIIGCGSSSPLASYSANTSSIFPIYTNPSLSLHKLFGFTANLDSKHMVDESRAYMQGKGLAGVTWEAIKKGPFSGWGKGLADVRRTGPYAQNGGEIIVEKGHPTFIHRMADSADHLDVPDLYRLLGFDQATIDKAGSLEKAKVEGFDNVPGVGSECSIGTKV